MLPESEWAEVVQAWNRLQPPSQRAELEHVEEALLAFLCWQQAISELRTIDAFEYLNRHLDFCRLVPDALLCVLTEDPCLGE